MAIKSNFNEADSMRNMQLQYDILVEKMINSCIRAGEDFIVNARSQIQDHSMGTYNDVTTNLRNSIEYFIFYNGELVRASASEFMAANRELVQEVILPRGIQLIAIAGMNYASYVEAKGYNVISYQADVMMVDLAMYLETLDVIEQGSAARMEETFIP
jgi:hypothetical protein